VNQEYPLIRDLVGRPGLDPGTLGVSAVDPRTSITVQILCFDDQDSPPTCVETLSEQRAGGLHEFQLVLEVFDPATGAGQLVGLETLNVGPTSDVNQRLTFPAIERGGGDVEFLSETLNAFTSEHPATRVVSKHCRVGKCHVHLRGSWPDSHKDGSVFGEQVKWLRKRGPSTGNFGFPALIACAPQRKIKSNHVTTPMLKCRDSYCNYLVVDNPIL
jgi:hypothetical protein